MSHVTLTVTLMFVHQLLIVHFCSQYVPKIFLLSHPDEATVIDGNPDACVHDSILPDLTLDSGRCRAISYVTEGDKTLN